MKQTIRIYLTVLVTLALCCVFTGLYFYQVTHPRPAFDISQFQGTYFDNPKDLPTFEMMATNGKKVTDNSFYGQWSMLFFGFTTCPDVCPTAMNTLSKLLVKLNQYPYVTKPHVYMITIDPKTDTIDKLKSYLSAFNKDFIGLNGNEHNVNILAKSLGIYYQNPHQTMMGGPIHSGAIVLINPNGKVVALLTGRYTVKSLFNDFTLVTQQHLS